jgi:hypothetical protein
VEGQPAVCIGGAGRNCVVRVGLTLKVTLGMASTVDVCKKRILIWGTEGQ